MNKEQRQVPFYKHSIGDLDLNSVLKSPFLTSGPRTREFEECFAKRYGLPFALGFTSWTSAAFLVLKAWGIGEGDEVIVPSMTFIATANVALHCSASVVFCDSDPLTGNLDLNHLKSLISPKTKAVIPVHLYGQMCDMKAIHELTATREIKILEDCAHCVEGTREGYLPGKWSNAACFSFYATKNLTCGEGGAAVTADEDLLKQLKLLRLHGMSTSAADRYEKTYRHWDMEILGYKANMNDLQAALLLQQLPRLESLLERRERHCQLYDRRFEKSGVERPVVLPNSLSARHLYTIWVPPEKRDNLILFLQEKGVGVAVNFRAVHTLTYYRNYLKQVGKKADCPVAERIGSSTITLPLYPDLTSDDINYVCDQVLAGLAEL